MWRWPQTVASTSPGPSTWRIPMDTTSRCACHDKQEHLRALSTGSFITRGRHRRLVEMHQELKAKHMAEKQVEKKTVWAEVETVGRQGQEEEGKGEG